MAVLRWKNLKNVGKPQKNSWEKTRVDIDYFDFTAWPENLWA